ncbi:MAG: DUF932 domain-containing protein [Rhodobacterales bacterium]|nr:DUF932 domain-containing protein [Rhodobacterales bacterium]
MLTFPKPLSIDQLHRFPVPKSPPWSAARSRWTPIPHVTLARAVVRTATERGLRLRSDVWQVSASGHDLLGSLSFHNNDGRWPSEVIPSIAVRHSNSGRHAVTVAIGAQVLVCSNGMLIGEVVLKRRHLPGLDVDALVGEGLSAFQGSGRKVQAFIDRLKDMPVRDTDFERLLVLAARRGVVSWSALRHVDQARANPVCEAFSEPTGWAAYNAFTEAIKRRSGALQLQSLRLLGELFDAESLENFCAA